MPIPCEACAAPVHERVVRCPHCGRPTGVVPDPVVTAEEAAAELELARRASVLAMTEPSLARGFAYGIAGILIDDMVIGVGAAAAALRKGLEGDEPEPPAEDDSDDDAESNLPRAIARVRRRERTITPAPVSVAPEPALPPAAHPRFLK